MRSKTVMLLVVAMILSGGAIGYSELMARQQAADQNVAATQKTSEPANDSRRIDGRAEFSKATSRGIQERIHRIMNSTLLPVTLDFGPEASLREILDQLEGAVNDDSKPQVRFLLDESDPEIGEDPAYLKVTTISGLSIPKHSMTLAGTLERILSKVKDQELTWVATEEAVLVTTVVSATSPKYSLVRGYDVSRLRVILEEMAASRERTVSGSGKGGFPMAVVSTWQDWLMSEVKNLTMDDRWIDRGGEVGTMSVVGDRLIVRQSRIGHEEVVEVLEELEQANPQQ